MGTEKGHHWCSCDVGEERESIKSKRNCVGFPSFHCFLSDIQDSVSLVSLLESRPVFPASMKCPHCVPHTPKHPFFHCSHRAQLWEDVLRG
jgi:hypothetical protein